MCLKGVFLLLASRVLAVGPLVVLTEDADSRIWLSRAGAGRLYFIPSAEAPGLPEVRGILSPEPRGPSREEPWGSVGGLS